MHQQSLRLTTYTIHRHSLSYSCAAGSQLPHLFTCASSAAAGQCKDKSNTIWSSLWQLTRHQRVQSCKVHFSVRDWHDPKKKSLPTGIFIYFSPVFFILVCCRKRKNGVDVVLSSADCLPVARQQQQLVELLILFLFCCTRRRRRRRSRVNKRQEWKKKKEMKKHLDSEIRIRLRTSSSSSSSSFTLSAAAARQSWAFFLLLLSNRKMAPLVHTRTRR